MSRFGSDLVAAVQSIQVAPSPRFALMSQEFCEKEGRCNCLGSCFVYVGALILATASSHLVAEHSNSVFRMKPMGLAWSKVQQKTGQELHMNYGVERITLIQQVRFK